MHKQPEWVTPAAVDPRLEKLVEYYIDSIFQQFPQALAVNVQIIWKDTHGGRHFFGDLQALEHVAHDKVDLFESFLADMLTRAVANGVTPKRLGH